MQKYVPEKKLETQQNHETTVQKVFPVKSDVLLANAIYLSHSPVPQAIYMLETPVT